MCQAIYTINIVKKYWYTNYNERGYIMVKFLSNDFLLQTKTAKKLYHGFAKTCPIIDYHCHVSPEEIYNNKRFSNITEVWLKHDHYKCGDYQRSY